MFVPMTQSEAVKKLNMVQFIPFIHHGAVRSTRIRLLPVNDSLINPVKLIIYTCSLIDHKNRESNSLETARRQVRERKRRVGKREKRGEKRVGLDEGKRECRER